MNSPFEALLGVVVESGGEWYAEIIVVGEMHEGSPIKYTEYTPGICSLAILGC